MKIKAALAVILSLIWGALLLSQVNLVSSVSAEGNPLVNPITYYAIKGRVLYKLNGWFRPAKDVTIEATNVQTNEKFTVLTNSNGLYALSVLNGQYTVIASDTRGTGFTPASYFVTVAGSNVTDINFLGILAR